MILVAGIGIAVLIEFLLVSKRKKSTADRILAFWIFLLVVHLFLAYAEVTGEIFHLPFLLGLGFPLPLLHGVFLYLYVASLTGQLPAKRWILLMQFFPAVMMYLYLAPFFALPAEEKIRIFQSHGSGYETFNTIRTYAYMVSGIGYVIWSALILRRYEHSIRDRFSDLAKIDLQWLQILTAGTGGIWVLVIIFRNDMLTLGGMVIFVFLIGFFGVRQASIFTTNRAASMNGEPKKYPKSGLTEETALQLHGKLLQLMKEEAPYKRSDLSVNDLASKLGVHPNYLSQVINQRENRNFYDFVNTYRIEEFKRLIADPHHQQLTLLSVAFDCGFNSKSSFNRYFKKATGQTPSDYFAGLTGTPNTPR